MKFEQTISNAQELISLLADCIEPGDRVWFRGQRKSSWLLTPSLARDIAPEQRIRAESLYIKTFKQNALSYAPHTPASEWEWLFLMQHYRAPTRLLDWSESPLVALFFASEPDTEGDLEDGALWCLWPKQLNSLAGVNLELEADLPFFEVDDYLDNYLPSKLASGSMTDLEPMAAGAQRRFQRLHAQLGVFTISQKSKQEITPGAHLAKITIPQDKKSAIKSQLALLGITQLSIFPELQSVGMLTKAIRL